MFKMRGHSPRPKGQALIEFMIFLPITVVFALSLVEIGMAFNVSQRVANVSREAANTALRLCWEDVPTEASVENCLTNTALPVLRDSVAPNTFPDFLSRGQVMISAYYWDGVAGEAKLIKCVSAGNSSSCSSRFNVASLGTLVQDLNLIFVGEFLYNYRSLMNLNFFSIPAVIYDHTIF